ncbi:MAG: hypothetical protein JRI83_12125 [Deltaproteobacteria bacterium]|nr:hypothetical protein [Deltaproteobacteria bacterium]
MENTNQTSESKNDFVRENYIYSFRRNLIERNTGVGEQEAIWINVLPSEESVPSKTQDQVLHEDSNTRIIAIDNFFAEKFFTIQQVEAVFFRDDDNSIQVWTLINELDRSIRNRIYEIEFSIMKRFPEIGFDFHVMSRNNRDIEEIIPAGMKIIKRFPWAA